MKNQTTFHRALHCLLFLASLFTIQGYAQPLAACAKVYCFTDRTLFVTGESVQFTALVISEQGGVEQAADQVLYCELITPEGQLIAAGKFPVLSNYSEGSIGIPDETVSGCYYLKTYTRSMRNCDVSGYGYRMISIVNPLKPETLQPGRPSLSEKLPVMESDSIPLINSGLIVINSHYRAGEEVTFSVSDSLLKHVQYPVMLSVVPAGTIMNHRVPAGKPAAGLVYDPYHQEAQGLSLSGRVVIQDGSQPAGNLKVFLSVIGTKDMMNVVTDSSGRFCFTLPALTGTHDIFLSAEEVSGSRTSILIDNDFCTRPLELPFPEFSLSAAEEKAALKLAAHKVMADFFTDTLQLALPLAGSSNKPFYGEVSDVISLNDYITLPSIEEYFNELSPVVKVRKVNGKKKFRFISSNPEMSLFSPLVMIDFIALDNLQPLLAVSPTEIERIELVNSVYIKGNITYGGIVSLISRKQNFAGIDLPSSGTFLSYRFFEPVKPLLPEKPAGPGNPDIRNTLFSHTFSAKEKEEKPAGTFVAPSAPGEYLIVLQGVDQTGKEFRALEKFVVTSQN